MQELPELRIIGISLRPKTFQSGHKRIGFFDLYITSWHMIIRGCSLTIGTDGLHYMSTPNVVAAPKAIEIKNSKLKRKIADAAKELFDRVNGTADSGEVDMEGDEDSPGNRDGLQKFLGQ